MGLITNEVFKPSKNKKLGYEDANGYENIYGSYYTKDIIEKDKDLNDGIFKNLFKNLLNWIDN